MTNGRGRTGVLAGLIAVICAACERNGDTGRAAHTHPAAGGAVTVWTDSTELFMEHPALIARVPWRFAVHLTDLTDFTPIRSGKVTLRFDPRGGGDPVVVSQDAPRSPGIYGPMPSFSRPGEYDLTVVVESPQARDTIRVPDLRVYATARDAPVEADGEEAGIAFLKEQQWKTPGFATTPAEPGTVSATVQAIGQLVPAAGRIARVSAPVAGLIETSGLAHSPSRGQRVTRGQTLAVLTPALGEGGSALARARAELREAEEEYARAERLYRVEAVPRRRLHEAEIRVTAAREAMGAFGGSAAARADGKLVLRAPLAGVVVATALAPGSRVEAGAELFTIVDPSVIWLEVNLPAADAARLGKGPVDSATSFRVPGSDSVHPVGRAVSIGAIVDSVSRTVPLIFEVANPAGRFRIGLTAQVAVATGQREHGIVIPSSAVLDEDGRPIAYVQVEGERFERRALTLGSAAGDRILVRGGIEPGERVVTGAAYQVRLASLSTGVPAHGHEH